MHIFVRLKWELTMYCMHCQFWDLLEFPLRHLAIKLSLRISNGSKILHKMWSRFTKMLPNYCCCYLLKQLYSSSAMPVGFGNLFEWRNSRLLSYETNCELSRLLTPFYEGFKSLFSTLDLSCYFFVFLFISFRTICFRLLLSRFLNCDQLFYFSSFHFHMYVPHPCFLSSWLISLHFKNFNFSQ
jgi:hypothetical protein